MKKLLLIILIAAAGCNGGTTTTTKSDSTPPIIKPIPKPLPAPDTIPVIKPVPVPTPTPVPVPTPTPKPDTVPVKPKPAPGDTLHYPYPQPIPIDTCDCDDTTTVSVQPPPIVPVTTKARLGMIPYDDANKYGLSFARMRIVVQSGNGMSILKLPGKAFYLPSVVWDSLGKTFPLDLTIYEQKLTAIVSAWNAKAAPWVVIENEPSFNETNGDVARYIAMMKIAIRLFKTKGVEVFIGGMTYPAVETYCYQLYLKDGDTKSAKVFKDNGGAGANKDAIDFVAGYLQHINDVGLNANFNFHFHADPGPMATLPLVLAKLKQIIKGKIIAGEVGFATQSVTDLNAALNAMQNIDAIIIYNGRGGGGAANDVAFTPDMVKALQNFK